MNTLVEQLVNGVVLKRKKTIPKKVIINAVHYVMSVVCGINRVKMEENKKTFPINYYGITFASSGMGKDLALDIVKPIAMTSINNYYAKLSEAYASQPDVQIPSVEFKGGTTSGFMQDRQALDAIGIGSTNIRVQELLATMRTSNFEEVTNLLVESWQSGENEAYAYKSYVSPPIKHVPMNCLLYSSPEGFRDSSNKSFNGFINDLANGLSRRSYVVFDDTIQDLEDTPTIETIKLKRKLFKESEDTLATIVSYVNDIAKVSNNKIIKVSEDASLVLELYDVENRNRTIKNQLMKSAVKAEIASRAFKVGRLAAMYAFFDGSDEVSEENIKDAIEWAEMLNKDLAVVLNAETIQEKIYDYMGKANKYVSETDIRKYLGITATEFRESKDELFSVAYEHGAVVQVKVFDEHGKVIRYNLIHGNETEPNKMICSASNHTAEGFMKLDIGYKQIPDLIRGKYGRNYSPSIFIDNYRKKDNAIKRAILLCLILMRE